MSEFVLATIIQGEAGVLGQTGMLAVAGVLMTQLYFGWSPDRIGESWYGRAWPGEYAWELAEGIVQGEVNPTGYLFCLSQDDVDKLGCRKGKPITRGRWVLYLYEHWPES